MVESLSEFETRRAMDRVVLRLGDLHTAPQVARRLLALTADLNYSVKDVIGCLESDPALVARVLRLVNSARYGLGKNITSLRQAITLLGLRSLRLITMTFTLVDRLTKGPGRRLYKSYWRSALTTAVVASRLSQKQPDLDPDAAYVAGLLTDVGVLVMAQADPDGYPFLHSSAVTGMDLVAAETAKYGFSHADIGAYLLERWEFAPELIEATRRHHDRFNLETIGTLLEEVTRMSSLTTEILWRPGSPMMATARELLIRYYGVGTDALISMAVDTQKEVNEQARVYGVDFDDEIDCEALRTQALSHQLDASIEAALELDGLAALLRDTAASL